METKKGACRFCGQNKMIEVPNGYTQEEIDEEVTCECKCDEAKAYQEKKEREERLEAQKLSAQGTTFELFHNDFPEVEQILNKTIPLLVTKKSKEVDRKHRDKGDSNNRNIKRNHQSRENGNQQVLKRDGA